MDDVTCLGNKDWISRYLDGELHPAEQTHFEEHLAGCPACQQEMAQTRALFAVLDGLQAIPAPAGFGPEVLAGLPRQSRSPVARWILVAQMAASLLLLALAYPTWRAWYKQLSLWLAPGWLSNVAADVMAWGKGIWAWLVSALTLDINLAWPQGFGLTWSQTAIMTLALVGLWWLGNRLLLAARPDQTGGTI